MSEAARSPRYRNLDYGTSAPADGAYSIPIPESGVPAPADRQWEQARERARERARELAEAKSKSKYSISFIALSGGVIAFFLMLFVVLGNVSYNELIHETVRLNAQRDELLDQNRRLEIEFMTRMTNEMAEIERVARDELGMSEPDEDQIIIVRSNHRDRVEVIVHTNDDGVLRGFGSFLRSLWAILSTDR